MDARQHSAPTRRELVLFGLLMAGVIAALGLFRWWRHGHVPVVFFGIAAVFLLAGLIAPAALRPVYKGWMWFGERLNRVMTFLLLNISFWLMIVPTGLLMRVFGDDPLKRKWDPEATTYWEGPDDQPEDLDPYRNQF